MSALSADLIEHVLETEGDPYLKTLDDELSFLVRNSVDTCAAMTAFVVLVVALSWQCLTRLHHFALLLQYHAGKKKKNL